MAVRRIGLVAAVAMVAFGIVACGAASGTTAVGGSGSGSRVIRVVAVENFWGSIAAQLGGPHAKVISIIDNPDADPHDYEATAADARAIAVADLVVSNGIGYDTWASKLLAANPAPRRIALTVGDVVGARPGANPHRWYNPDDVATVVDRLSAAYRTLDPADAAVFDRLKVAFETTALAGYRATIAEIRAKYAGTPVGASESIFAMVAPALGLDLITPPSFLTAISAGADPTAADKATVDAQITGKKIKVYVYNAQNATPDVQTQISQAKAAGIPVTAITETLVPATSTWQAWQTAQLQRLRDALAQAAGA
ncbi:MAG TPA: zinc ABC transporter substrate-binding protein [Kineosporiaceae bacterium]